MTKKTFWVLGVLAVVLLTLGGREFFLMADGKTHIVFFDIGQGDSALITLADGKHILIDGGPDWSTLEKLGQYMPFFDRRIDLVILSHPHLDHLASFPEVLRRYSVGALITAGTAFNSGTYSATLSGATLRGIPVLTMYAGQTIDLETGTLDILWPPKDMPIGIPEDANTESLTVRFSHNGKRVLFTGDIENIPEKTLVEAGADLKADILKVAHHGSKTSSSTGFLLAVGPKISIVSVAKENSYGHPNAGVLQRLKNIGSDVRRTDLEGDIELEW